MPWQYFRSNDGSYEVNWEMVTAIVRSSERAAAVSRNTRAVVEQHKWNPFLPDVTTIEVNWDKVREETKIGTELKLREFHLGAQRSMRTQIMQLHQMIEMTRYRTDEFLAKQKEAQHKNMENIESSVRHGEIAVETLTIIRDTCAEFDMVAATVFSGGVAAGVVGTAGGSLVKGTASYMEKRKFSSAVATFGANFAMGMLDLGVTSKLEKLAKLGQISKLDKVGYEFVWAKAQGALEIPKSLMEGKDIKHAATAGAVKMGASSPLFGLHHWLEHSKSLHKMAFPVAVAMNVIQDHVAERLASSHSHSAANVGPAMHHHVDGPLNACVFDPSQSANAVRPLYSAARGA